MTELRLTARFQKQVAKLGPELRKRAQKSLETFIQNPRHPHLHFEKLSTGYRTIKVDTNFRIVLRHIDGGVFEVVDVGNHTRIYQEYG